ncbi:hypothetical protein ACLB2K_007808 [Fragaria x ananassa]
MVPSPQVPSRGGGGDVPETCWQEDKFNVALASQSALGWGLSRDGHPRLIGDCREVVSQSALDWGLRLMWRGSLHLIGDCREVASQSALDWGLRLHGEAVRA